MLILLNDCSYTMEGAEKSAWLLCCLASIQASLSNVPSTQRVWTCNESRLCCSKCAGKRTCERARLPGTSSPSRQQSWSSVAGCLASSSISTTSRILPVTKHVWLQAILFSRQHSRVALRLQRPTSRPAFVPRCQPSFDPFIQSILCSWYWQFLIVKLILSAHGIRHPRIGVEE